MVVHTFNPSTREEYIKRDYIPAFFQSEDFIELRALQWLGCFAFLIFSLSPSICHWVFIIHATFDIQHLRYEFIGWSYMRLESLPYWLGFSFLFPGGFSLNPLLGLLLN